MAEPVQGHPLLRALGPAQRDLLRFVWEPIAHANRYTGTPLWPVWDFVQRRLYQDHPELTDAFDVLDSLPRLRRPQSAGSYGLIWTEHGDLRPGPTSRIGLSIAGLHVLGRADSGSTAAAELANALAGHIGLVAEEDGSLPPDPTAQAKADVPLRRLLQEMSPDLARQLNVVLTAEVLKHEYPRLLIVGGDDPMVQLGRVSLRPYRGPLSSQSYLDLVALLAAAAEPPVIYSSGHTLVQSLDYLGYVLGSHPAWPAKLRLTHAPDLQSASALTAPVSDQQEYASALSGLFTVIDQLRVPPAPAEELAVLDGQEREATQKTVNALHRWLRTHLPAESQDRIDTAVRVLRDVRELRNEIQHSRGTRDKAALARARLGLPQTIMDWATAWEKIKNQLAGALDTIREEVQAAASGSAPEGG